MMRNIIISMFLSVVVFLPTTATAQFFARQKVVVWEVFDRNNDVKVAEGTKVEIQQYLKEALDGSENYEPYMESIERVNQWLQTQNLPKSPANIAKAVKGILKVDYVIFTTIKILQRSSSFNGYEVHISSEFYSTETLKSERMAYVDMKSDLSLVPSKCAELIGKLLGETVQLSQTTTQTTPVPQQPQYQQQYTYSQTPQPYVENANCGLNMKMVYVEGGTFQMGATSEQGGDAEGDETPVHTVTLDSYYIAECEVTQAQWQKIMGTTLSEQKSKAGASSTYGVGDNYPMYYVSWEEAQDFCRELSRITGKKYRLPTEAQWEYAARGGKHNSGAKYSGRSSIATVAWYTENSGSTTHAVKQKTPNELGLYDMSGNVWEWCNDWYSSSYYSSSPQNNPTGPSSGSDRVLRGGSWGSAASKCRVSYRGNNTPSSRSNDYGFRVVCLP